MNPTTTKTSTSKFRTRFERKRVIAKQQPKGQKGRTHQEFKDGADINKIMSRYKKTGLLPLIKQQPKYGDFSDVPSYVQALQIQNTAHTQFMALSARVRARFSNDPKLFLEFVNNPANAREMVELGLATLVPPKEAPAPVKAKTKGKESTPAPKEDAPE